jgi:hypothetical protein
MQIGNKVLMLIILALLTFVLYRRGLIPNLVNIAAPRPPSASPGLDGTSLPAPEIPKATTSEDIRSSEARFPIPVCSWHGDESDSYKNTFAAFPSGGPTKQVQENYASYFSNAGQACSRR